MVHLDCIETYPEALKQAVLDNPTLVKAYDATFDPSKSFEDNVQHFDFRLVSQSEKRTIATVEQLISAAGNCWFEGFHITRIIDPHEICDRGIQILDWETYRTRIDTVLTNNTDLRYNEKCYVLALILEYYKNDGVGRYGHLSFFSPASKYVLDEYLNIGFTRLYGNNIGGELLEHSLINIQEYKALIETLQRIGNKYLIRFQFQLQDLFRGTCDHPYDLFLNTIAFAVLYCRDFGSLPHDALFVSHLRQPVPPENILSMSLLPTEMDESD